MVKITKSAKDTTCDVLGTPTIAIDDMLHPSKHYLLFYIIIDSIEYIESVVRTNERTNGILILQLRYRYIRFPSLFPVGRC